MRTLLRNGWVFTKAGFQRRDVLLEGGAVVLVPTSQEAVPPLDGVLDLQHRILSPGFTDVHVHFREPGFSYKETMRTGTLAAARGGYTSVCTMPNLNPAPSTPEALAVQKERIRSDAQVRVHPYGTITRAGDGRSSLADMEALASEVVAFTDDGHGVQGTPRMEEAMREAKRLGKIIVAHCEDETLVRNGYIHEGRYSAAHGHRGICSESEWKQVERDLALAESIGCAYHVCHVSTKESVELIRQAKARGVDVTCETAPHYLLLCEDDLQEEGRFKMNPPLRSREDRAALVAGLRDGTIDMVATDHAPHSAEEKAKGLEKSAFGIVGLETAFAVLYTKLVRTGQLSLETLLDRMALAPARRFGLPCTVFSETPQPADFTLLDLDARWTIRPEEFLSKGKATPFAGWEVVGRPVWTVVGGKTKWGCFS